MALLCTALMSGVACSDDDHSSHKTYDDGDFYDVGGVKGVVFETTDDGRHGLIVSLDETTAAWSTELVKTNAVDVEDGAKNQSMIEKIDGWQSKYPAFAWCAAKNTNGLSGWFLPAYDQLVTLYDEWTDHKESFNKALTDNGGTAIDAPVGDSEIYWSSSEILTDKDFAGGFRFNQAVPSVQQKTLVFKVRAVHAF